MAVLARAVDGEESGVEAPHALGWRDGSADEMQRLQIGKHTPFLKGRPGGGCGGAVRTSIIPGPEQKARLLEGLADGSERQSPTALGRGPGDPGHQRLLGAGMKGTRHGHGSVAGFDAPAGKDELAGHEFQALMPLAHEHLRVSALAVDDDEGRGVDGAEGRVLGIRFG